MNVRIFESMRRNASVHRQDLSLYSHLKEYLGNGVRAHVNSKGKIPSTRSSEDQTHETASHRAASPTHYDKAGFTQVSLFLSLCTYYCSSVCIITKFPGPQLITILHSSTSAQNSVLAVCTSAVKLFGFPRHS